MNKEYYKQYYHFERNHWWFLIRNKIILNKVKKLVKSDNITILNVGAATGRTSELLSEIGLVTSVEYDNDCCEFLKNELNIDAIQSSITQLPFKDNEFDMVCALDVIEHVEDDQTAVNELLRVCKHGGNILLTVPALMSLWSYHDIVNMHYRRYTRKQLLKLCKNIPQLRVNYTSYFNSILFLPIWFYRIISGNTKQKEGKSSDFEVFDDTPILNRIMKAIFSIEIILLKLIKLPIGVSILLIGQKK